MTEKKPKNARKVASLQINSPGKMSIRERRDIAEWLEETAFQLKIGYPNNLTNGKYTESFSYYKD